MKTICFAGAVVVAFNFCGQAQDLDGKFKDLQKVGEGFAAATALGSGSESLRAVADEYRDFSNNFSSLQSYVQNGNYDQAILTLKRWMARTKNEQIRKALDEILKALQKEQETRQTALAAKVDKALSEAAKAIATARTTDEVAKVQIGLEELRDFDLNNGERSTRRLMDQINRAIQFISNWQMMLLDEESGNYRSALQTLNNLRRNPSSYRLLDSKALAAKADFLFEKSLASGSSEEGTSTIAKLIAKEMAALKSPADAAAVADRLEALRQATSGQDNQAIYQVKNQLDRLAEMDDDFRSGAYARVISAQATRSSRNPYTPQIEGLADQLRIRAVAAANNLPDLGTPNEKEGFSTFIRRRALEAFEKKDWPRLYTLLSVYSSVSGGGCAKTEDIKQGIRAFLAAQQLEQAGQFRAAVARYTDCIAEVGKMVPREEAAAALAKIRTEHPEAFEVK